MNILVIPDGNIYHLTPLNSIVSCNKGFQKTVFALNNNESLESDLPLSYFEKKLYLPPFYKPNANSLININHISKITLQKPLYLMLKNHQTVPIDPEKIDALIQIIQNRPHFQSFF
ncbi:MAG: LytTR family transcriptional regulator DNA-binding domain-containing protein [Salinivirgaceae bacterium]